ncbi:MAG TPA: gliding motility-associated ABC transporter ATP-binding subunit GldA [Bacteroidales bacterium]|jgi:ABC-2 type transport system ATP-binding protein|nr:gliding motility-associated ABC transporter ATP-binding subunit GldA [Bacteroidales bacterium]HQM68241.1 gliding motility-associated ABC transporter ATP-binding subunit GldA [Bacteroidales bacterium]
MSIVVQEVTKLYGSQKALDNVSFSVKTGEIVAFLGPNGAGKSTMMKIITGFIPPSSGSVLVNGTEVSSDDPEIRKKIGYLPENNPLYPEMYVREYLSFVASFYKPGRSAKENIENIIGLTGLTPEAGKKIGALSKGYRQRVGLAQALIHDPDVLILDEATSGLDPNQIIEIRNLIREAGRKKTVLLSTHIMQEAEAVCDRIIIIDKGVIVADEDKNNIYSKINQGKQIIKVSFDRKISDTELLSIPNVHNVRLTDKDFWLLESDSAEDIRPAVFSFAVKNNLTVLSLQKEENNLEEVFRHLTGM